MAKLSPVAHALARTLTKTIATWKLVEPGDRVMVACSGGKDWIGAKVKQYSEVMRADFGAYVQRKKFRLS